MIECILMMGVLGRKKFTLHSKVVCLSSLMPERYLLRKIGYVDFLDILTYNITS